VQGQQKTQGRADRDSDLAPLAGQSSRCEAIDPDRAQPESQRMERVKTGKLQRHDAGWPERHEQRADPSGRTARYSIGPPEDADHKKAAEQHGQQARHDETIAEQLEPSGKQHRVKLGPVIHAVRDARDAFVIQLCAASNVYSSSNLANWPISTSRTRIARPSRIRPAAARLANNERMPFAPERGAT
jgi:hypothetical protein